MTVLDSETRRLLEESVLREVAALRAEVDRRGRLIKAAYRVGRDPFCPWCQAEEDDPCADTCPAFDGHAVRVGEPEGKGDG